MSFILFLCLQQHVLTSLCLGGMVTYFVCNSETVKFGHVTFFWNGNRSGYFDETKEEYVEIPSDSGITFNVAPKMKALEIAEKARDALLSGKFDQVNDSVVCIKLVFEIYPLLSVLLL